MKSTVKVVWIVLLVWAQWNGLCASASAQTVEAIQISDETGFKEKVSNPSLIYSNRHENQMNGHLQLVFGETPRRQAWVHFSRIGETSFAEVEGDISVSIKLDNGDMLSGTFPDSELRIFGKTALGKVTYGIKKIKAIEFLEFSEGWGDKKRILSRQESSSSWENKRELTGTWKVLDGDRTFEAQSVHLWDSYTTNVRGSFIYLSSNFRVGEKNARITVLRGSAEYLIPLNEIRELRITGKEVDGKPEVVVRKMDGGEATCTIKMRKDHHEPLSGPALTSYGEFEEDDYALWYTPYGWQGISLFPLRPIRFTLQ